MQLWASLWAPLGQAQLHFYPPDFPQQAGGSLRFLGGALSPNEDRQKLLISSLGKSKELATVTCIFAETQAGWAWELPNGREGTG